jgi:hypothetical protein
LGRGERKRDLAGSVAGGRDERKRNPAGNPRTPAGSLSVAGGRGERKRDSAGFLSVAGGRGWVEVESAGSLFPSPDLSLSPVVRPRQCHGGANGFFYLTVQVVGYFSNISIFLVLVDVSTDYWWA